METTSLLKIQFEKWKQVWNWSPFLLTKNATNPPQDEYSPIPTSLEPSVAQLRQPWVLYPNRDGPKEILRNQEKVAARRAISN